MKKLILLIILLMFLSTGCKANEAVQSSSSAQASVTKAPETIVENSSNSNKSSDPNPKDDSIISTDTSQQPFTGRIHLSELENFFYGTWKVEKLLGFANSYNDASEYSTGQKIIGDEFIIKKNFFSSKGLKNYNAYQHELKNPSYDITAICYDSASFYSIFKIVLPGLNINDEVKWLQVSADSTDIGIPLSFFVVNNDRLILLLEATCFELKKVND